MSTYDSSSIEVLTGLEPVRKRPGMYTTTERPNHLAQEVIDNSADEAIAGYCDEIAVTLHDDGSMSVSDNGRGMPVDKHAKEGVSGVEVILTRLHAGAKFSEENYRVSGGRHGVGLSLVNSLLKTVEVAVRAGEPTVPDPPFVGQFKGSNEEGDWAVVGLTEEGEVVTESYVNLIPTTQGGPHVNGFRTGLTDAIREFCELRNLLPRGVKLTPEDVWSRCSYILSLRMSEPQFTGQTKDRLTSPEASAFVSGVTPHAFSTWQNNTVTD